MAPLIPNGCYIVCQRGNQHLAMLENRLGGHVNIIADEAAGKWIVENLPNGRIILRNAKCNKYAGLPEGDPSAMMPILVSEKPVEFLVQPAEQPRCFKLCVPTSEAKCYLGVHPVLIFPPWAGIVHEGMARDPWQFIPCDQ